MRKKEETGDNLFLGNKSVNKKLTAVSCVQELEDTLRRVFGESLSGSEELLSVDLNSINVYVPSRLVSFFISDCWRSIYIYTKERERKEKREREIIILGPRFTDVVIVWKRSRNEERLFSIGRSTRTPLLHSSDYPGDDFMLFSHE